MPHTPSLILLALVITGYIAIGGLKDATYSSAIQMVIKMVALPVPLVAVLKAMDAPCYRFPPMGYGALTNMLLERIPSFFDLKFEAAHSPQSAAFLASVTAATATISFAYPAV